MYRNHNNLKVVAKANGTKTMKIFLDASGQKIFLCDQGFNQYLYQALRYSVRLEDLRDGRIKPPHSVQLSPRKLREMTYHILKEADEYITRNMAQSFGNPFYDEDTDFDCEAAIRRMRSKIDAFVQVA